MLYENRIKKLKDEITNYKNDNMKLQAEVLTLKDKIRELNNEKTFLESYNSRLLYIVKTQIVPNDIYKDSRKWRQNY